mmetsp:Transcript_22662/g.56134  ORF Transcript_22662/g.56134 Transcript_22662/m.56134 type:complete len:329 (+) Transcript_22662:1433-2419(+)
MPCTPPSKMPRSPKMSERYSISSVVAKVKGEPTATDHPSAMSVALPVASWCTAKEALMPEPPTSLPCSYRRRTEGPMPLGATSTTLMSGRKVSPSESMTPRRKPCERPRVEPGFMAARMRGYNFACAASEMSSITRSDLAMTSKVSPSVPSSSLKLHLRASSLDVEEGRRPMQTLASIPASASESRKFCACAGAWEPQPMTPIVLMPLSASGSLAKRCLPPRTMYSPSPATSTSSFSKIFVSMSSTGALVAARTPAFPEARAEVHLTLFLATTGLEPATLAARWVRCLEALAAATGAAKAWEVEMADMVRLSVLEGRRGVVASSSRKE